MAKLLREIVPLNELSKTLKSYIPKAEADTKKDRSLQVLKAKDRQRGEYATKATQGKKAKLGLYVTKKYEDK